MTIQTKGSFRTFSDEEFKQFLAGMRATDYVAIDTESDGNDLRSGKGYVLGLSVAFELGSIPMFSAYFPFRHYDTNYSKDHLAQLKEVIENLDCVIYHNAKHDIVALENLGIYHTGKFYDTMLMAHLLNENYFSKGLDWLSKELLNDHKDRGKTMDQFIKAFGWGMAPAWMIEEYAEHDAVLTLNLFKYFLAMWEKEGLESEWVNYRQKFVRLIKKMEGRGVRVDTEFSKRELDKGLARMEEIVAYLDANPGSPNELEKMLVEDMGLPVFGRTKTGKISFNKHNMELYEELLEKSDNPTATLILEYRGWQKTTSSNYKPYLKLLGPDGRVRCNYKLHGTVTGRLSCADPNLQQIPRESNKEWNGTLKQAFIPEEGYTLWEFDYKNLELRLGAAYARENGLIEILNDRDRDVFLEMAATLGMARQDCKTLVYTMQFGGGIPRLSFVFAVPEWKAKQIRDNFFRTYPGLRSVAQRASAVARHKGKIKVWTGRYRHFDSPSTQNHKAFNAVVQGGAADIVIRTMLRLEDAVDNEENCRMLLQVHDSVVFEIKNGHEDIYIPQIVEVMEDVQPDFGVNFYVDAHKWGVKE